LNDVGRNSLLGNGKKIAKFLMRTFTCRSTFLYGHMFSMSDIKLIKHTRLKKEMRCQKPLLKQVSVLNICLHDDAGDFQPTG
jgi:hypothetical protein